MYKRQALPQARAADVEKQELLAALEAERGKREAVEQRAALANRQAREAKKAAATPILVSNGTQTASRDFKAAVACLDRHNVETEHTRIAATNGAVEVFAWDRAKATLMVSVTRNDTVRGAVMLVQGGGDLISAVTVFSFLGGCLLGVDRKLVTQTMLRQGISAIGGAYFLHSESKIYTMAMAWTKEDVKDFAK